MARTGRELRPCRPGKTAICNVKPGQGYRVTTTPKILAPGEICTETYIVVNAFKERLEAENYVTYYKTKFMRFLVKLSISSVNISKEVFSFVPKQDFSKPWTDAELYAKYGLTDEEIAFIEKTIKPLD